MKAMCGEEKPVQLEDQHNEYHAIKYVKKEQPAVPIISKKVSKIGASLLDVQVPNLLCQ
jgi:hypothetical protein